LAETSDPAARPLWQASTRAAANKNVANFDFTVVVRLKVGGGIESALSFNIIILPVKRVAG
jgi:hypothetical protein